MAKRKANAPVRKVMERLYEQSRRPSVQAQRNLDYLLASLDSCTKCLGRTQFDQEFDGPDSDY